MKLHNPFETDKATVIASTIVTILTFVVGIIALSFYHPAFLLILPLVPISRLIWYILKGK